MLMKMLYESGYPMCDVYHHESDLYIFATNETKKLITKWCSENNYSFNHFCDVFIDQATNKYMYDVAFQYNVFDHILYLLNEFLTEEYGEETVIKEISEDSIVDLLYTILFDKDLQVSLDIGKKELIEVFDGKEKVVEKFNYYDDIVDFLKTMEYDEVIGDIISEHEKLF